MISQNMTYPDLKLLVRWWWNDYFKIFLPRIKNESIKRMSNKEMAINIEKNIQISNQLHNTFDFYPGFIMGTL